MEVKENKVFKENREYKVKQENRVKQDILVPMVKQVTLEKQDNRVILEYKGKGDIQENREFKELPVILAYRV
jgi:hypothetical protein